MLSPILTQVISLLKIVFQCCLFCLVSQTALASSLNPIPTAILVSGSDTICSGATVTLTVNLTGGGPYSLVYSINNISQAPVVTSLATLSLPVMPPVGQYTVRLVSVTNASGVGMVSGQFSVTVNGIPTGRFLAPDTTVCNGDTTQLRLKFTGAAPFIYNYSVGGVLQGPDTAFTALDTLFIMPAGNTTYVLQTLSGDGCAGTSKDTIVVTVPPPVSAEISGGGQICQNGTGTQIQFTFQGPGPYTFVYTINNVAQPPITTSLSTYTLTVNPSIGTFYFLQSVTNNGICFGEVSGQAVVFVFSPPTANLTGGGTFCNQANSGIMVDFTGTGPFTIIYTANGVAQPPDTTSDDPYFLPISITNTTTYVLTNTESPGCIGSAMGSATVTVNHSPSYANLAITCNAAAMNYQVEFDVLNGTPPYTLVSGSGTFTGNHFVSTALPELQNYSFVFRDALNCGDVTVSGVPNCVCTSDAGTMSLTTVNVSQTDIVTVPAATGTLLDSDDTLLYILHTNPALPIGTIISWNGQPQFSFQAGMQTEVLYYISAIVGNVGANNQVDPNDVCQSVSQGTPVIFHATPTATLATLDTSICVGESVALPINFTGTPPFSFVYALSSVNQPPVTNISTSNYAIILTPVQSTNVQLISVSDQFSTNGTVTGQAMIAVNRVPQFGTDTVICDYNSLTYMLSFDIENGNAPYDLSGVSGTFNGNTFTSSPYPFGEPYFVYIRDTFDCGADTLIGIPPCACTSDAGTMSNNTPLSFCRSTPATAAYDGNQTLDNDDIQVFVLHTSATDVLGTILATSTTPSFDFLPNFILGTTYYISAVVGSNDGSGGVLLTDACLSVAPGTPVVWHAEPTATITGNYDLCPGVPQGLTVIFTGEAPFQFSYTNNGQSMSGTATQTVFNIIANLQQSATFILTAVQDANCPGTVSGQAVVTVHPTPIITTPVITCATDNETYTVEFDVLNSSTATITGTVPGSLDNNGHFISNAIPIQQNYSFQAIDNQFNCGGDTLSGTPVCPCTTNAGVLSPTPLLLCVGDTAMIAPSTNVVLDGNDTMLYYLATMPNPPNWTALGINSTPFFAYNAATMTPGTTYYIVAVAGNSLGGAVDLNDPCLAFTTGPTVVWRVPPTATLSGTTNICPGDAADLFIQFTGTGLFDFTYSANGIVQNATSATNNYSLVVSPADTTVYTLLSVTGMGGCPGTVSGTDTVSVNPIPTATISGDTTICQGGSAALRIQFTGTAPFQLMYALNGDPQALITASVNPFFISTSNVQAAQAFTLLSMQDAYCDGTMSGMATVQTQPAPTGSIQQDITICRGDSTLLTLQLSGGTTYDVTISGGLQPIQLDSVTDGATFMVMPGTTTTYTISQLTTTGNTCPTIMGQNATVTVTNLSATATVMDYNGFNVSCPNEPDGKINIMPIGGTLPIMATWSDGSSGLQLLNVPAGTYSLLLTDQTGCTFRDSFVLTAPPGLSLRFQVQAPPCADDRNGSFTLDSIAGGVAPYTLTIDGQISQAVDSLPLIIRPLSVGTYTLSVEDANGCPTEEIFSVAAPLPLIVDLGPDITIAYGDSTLLEAEVNSTIVQTFLWTPSAYLQQPTAQATWARPPETRTYEVQVADTSGCKASDQILVIVEKKKRVYIPNVIALNSDSYNHVLTVFAGAEVQNVRYLRIYDRWGTCLYEGLDLPTNDSQFGWSGMYKGKKVTPGVYIYTTEVQYIDGTTEVFSGDVTVVH